jgi:hypothetical protein
MHRESTSGALGLPDISLPPGGTVARAKRTDRAEARRRYRATLIEESLPLDPDSDSPAETDAAEERVPTDRSRNRAPATTSAGPPPRPNIIGALRGAYHPTDLRGDLAALPRLLRHRAFLIPLALIVAATTLLLVTGGREQISLILAPYFLAPPPVVPVFVAGFLAPRASYLLGALLGAISMVASVALLSSPALQPVTGAGAVTLEPVVVANSFLTSILFGALFAAVAAWYRRFLTLANPNRAARAAGKPADRSRRRGGDDRPLLARRR